MGCHRKGCSNIMCDICVDSSYYICYDCSREFRSYYALSEKKIMPAFLEFMKVEKPSTDLRDADKEVDEFFNRYTREY